MSLLCSPIELLYQMARWWKIDLNFITHTWITWWNMDRSMTNISLLFLQKYLTGQFCFHQKKCGWLRVIYGECGWKRAKILNARESTEMRVSPAKCGWLGIYVLMSFTGKTLPEKLSLELRLQFSFCFFVRLRPPCCYIISFVIARMLESLPGRQLQKLRIRTLFTRYHT